MSLNLRNALGATVAVGLAVVGLQLTGVGSAFAHNASVSGVATCAQNGTYSVTWTISNTRTSFVETATVRNAVPSGSSVPSSLTIPANSSRTVTQTGIPGTAKTAGITVHAFWAGDNFTENPDPVGSLSLRGTCAALVTTTTPSAANGACVDDEITSPSIDIPKQSGVRYAIDGKHATSGEHAVSVGRHVVTAASTNSTKLTGRTSWTYDLKRANGRCTLPTAKPVSPDLDQAQCTGTGLTTPTLTLPDTEGVRYTTSKRAPYSPGEDVKVTATLTKGHRWGSLPSTWTKKSDTRAVRTVRFHEAPACNGFEGQHDSNTPNAALASNAGTTGPNGGLAATGNGDFGPVAAIGLAMLAGGMILVRRHRRVTI